MEGYQSVLDTKYSSLSLKQIKVIKPDTKVSKVLELFNELHSQIGIQSHNETNLMAIIGYLDITKYIINSYQNGKIVFDEPIENCLTLNPEDESYLVWQRDTEDVIRDAMKAFAEGIHRGLIIDKCLRLLTQKDIIQYISKTQELQASLDLPIVKFLHTKNLSETNKVFSVDESWTILQGFQHLLKYNIPSMPILSKNSVVGTFSSAVILKATVNDFQNFLNQPISILKQNASITCKPSTTCREILEAMLSKDEARAWCVDSNGSPTGVISMSDIIGVLVGVVPATPLR
ncbi:hypothetical protein BC833DRAFT_590974 [Globomyces pollinis-pini]|nr:hypothetical protein BC833DRAFT_590974 [Globomyces pollinis-pini]